ncbi:MAG: hypothetical protein CVV14_02935 [Gammaproteobacteria bacterium HGW-Gammaproteobacteria-4]|jgi:hypothetical protein|nr:MAG: hypothetical protein CVV14_02935 [Gammaproteobacteria bacterium HGW-Gammaproteobacteria-4]
MIFRRIRSGAFSAIPGTLLLAAFLAFVVLVLRIAATESPIMSSDEYAYVANAKYVDAAAQVHQMDPGLQQVENRVYPALYAVWKAISPHHTALAGRILNALSFVLGAFILFAIFSRVFDRKSALVSALLYLALPLSFYATTLLPEVEFQLSIYLVAGVVVLAGPRPRYLFIALAAALCALSYFIKPHAAALILACSAYWFATGLLERDATARLRWRRALSRTAVFGTLTGLLIVVVTKLLPADAASSAGIMPSFYVVYIGQIFDVAFLSRNLISVVNYVGGHFWVLLVLFTPGLVAIAGAVHGLLRGGENTLGAVDPERERRACFALFIALTLAAFLLMVALFTSSAAMGNDFERDRLHGRYLAGLLPFLLAYSVWASSRAGSRLVPLLATTALVGFFFIGSTMYHLFPWDYPDAFGFFRPAPHSWTFDGALTRSAWWLLVLGIGCWLFALRFKASRLPYAAFALLWMLAGHAQMARWAAFQSGQNRPIIAAANAIDTFLGDVSVGSGLIATSDRYGATSTLLMALDTPQYVRTFAAHATLGPADVPEGVRWIVVPHSMGVDIAGSAELHFADQRLVLLDATYRWPLIRAKNDWDGRPLMIDTGYSGTPALLHGFNDAEEWGSWSRLERAVVELPVRIGGPLVIEFFAWQVANHPDFILRIRVGDAVREIRLSATGRDYRVVLYPAEEVDRVVFESNVVRTAGESRGLGVALARLRISRAEPQTE